MTRWGSAVAPKMSEPRGVTEEMNALAEMDTYARVSTPPPLSRAFAVTLRHLFRVGTATALPTRCQVESQSWASRNMATDIPVQASLTFLSISHHNS